MKYTVSRLAGLSGVSVRTLHYYDEIGILKPSSVTEKGYRYYGDEEISRLKEIMLLKELEFSLKQIKEILKAKTSLKKVFISEQKELLKLKKKRIEKLIEMIETGTDMMDFKEFDNSEYENKKKEYAKEVKAKYEKSNAYKEFKIKNKGRTEEEEKALGIEMNKILAEFSDCDGLDAGDDKVQKLVKKLQAFITDNYYTCTDEILGGLGQMYVDDDRFKKNIDKHGEGTANLINSAIKEFLKK